MECRILGPNPTLHPAHPGHVDGVSAFEAIAAKLRAAALDKVVSPQPLVAGASSRVSLTTVAGLFYNESTPLLSQRSTTAVCAPSPMEDAKGESSLMRPTGPALHHPLAATLSRWSQDGVDVDCGNPWSRDALEASIAKGPHVSALTPEAIALVHEDVEYQCKGGFAEVILWDDLKKSIPRHLKLSPVAVVPQRDRRGRIILDLSFPVLRSHSSRAGKRGRHPEDIL